MADLVLRPAAAPQRESTGVDRVRVWRAATSPFWAWSDVPAPDLPAREPKPAAALGLAGQVFLGVLDRIRTRLWLRGIIHGLLRGMWLALALACVWMIWSLLTGGSALDLGKTGLAMAAGAILGVVAGLLAKPSRRRTAAMLDRTWGLQERMVTAVEDLGLGVPGEGERAPVTYLQMADAANTIELVRKDPALAVRPPVREVVLVVFWALVLAALAFLRGVGGAPPALTEGFVPPFTPAAEMIVQPEPQAQAAGQEGEGPDIEEILARSQRSNEARRDLQALASALADHAVTRQAADAIGQGDYERAADELRRLAPDAPDLSDPARQELAGDIDAAASTMAGEDSTLRQASEDAASGLRQGERPAQEGLRSLAEAVETTGQQVAPQSELADQMRQAQQRDPAGTSEAQRRLQEERAAAQAQAQAGQPGGESGEAGRQGDPGEGARAEAGQAQQAGQQGQGERGQGENGAPGQGSNPGEGQSGQGQQGEANESGQGSGDERGDSAEAGQGGGAGSGETGENEGENQPGSGGEGGEEGSPGDAAEQRVTEGDGGQGESGEAGEVSESISLPSSPGGQQGVQTTADGGSALPGAGAGVTAGSGTAAQGEIAESGPDSNHVPAEYRDIVENYFSAPGGR
jgi:hypothetical protein